MTSRPRQYSPAVSQPAQQPPLGDNHRILPPTRKTKHGTAGDAKITGVGLTTATHPADHIRDTNWAASEVFKVLEIRSKEADIS